MKSPDYHINPDFRKFQLDLLKSENNTHINMYHCTIDKFTHLQELDPIGVYIVHYPGGGTRVFYGEIPLVDPDMDPPMKYVMGFDPDKNVYDIYLSLEGENYKIASYNNVKIALNALQVYNVAQSTETQDIDIYSNLLSYTDEMCALHEFILGTIGCLYNIYDPKFQDLQDAVNIMVNNIIAFKPRNMQYKDSEMAAKIADAIEYDRRFNSIPLFMVFKDILNSVIKFDYYKKQRDELKRNKFPSFKDELKDIKKIYENIMKKPR